MSYVVLARKYRPTDLENLVGQTHISRALTNAVAMDRVHHAFLFCGVHGTGKTSTARILAKMLNCHEGPTAKPCGTCTPCTEIAQGKAIDVREIDAASNRGINEMREIREGAMYAASRDRYRVYIIDEAHMLTTEAANAFLKRLEEPPPGVYFILATTDPQRLPVTIRSRCQRYDFRRIRSHEIVARLRSICEQESVELDDEALFLVAREAAGSMRDALSVLDQILAFGAQGLTSDEIAGLLGVADRKRVTETLSAVFSRDSEAALESIAACHAHGVDLKLFARSLAVEARDRLIVRLMAATAKDMVDRSESELAEMARVSAHLPDEELERAAHVLLDVAETMATAHQPRLMMEMALLRLCRAPRLRDVAQLAAQVDRLVTADRAELLGDLLKLPATPDGAEKKNETVGAPRPAPRPESTLVINDQDLVRWVEAARKGELLSLVPILEDCVVTAARPGHVVLGFRSPYAKSHCQENRKKLQEAAVDAFGADLQIDEAQMDQRAETDCIDARRKSEEERRHQRRIDELKRHPTVDTVVNLFEAKVTEIQLEDESTALS